VPELPIPNYLEPCSVNVFFH